MHTGKGKTRKKNVVVSITCEIAIDTHMWSVENGSYSRTIVQRKDTSKTRN